MRMREPREIILKQVKEETAPSASRLEEHATKAPYGFLTAITYCYNPQTEDLAGILMLVSLSKRTRKKGLQ